MVSSKGPLDCQEHVQTRGHHSRDTAEQTHPTPLHRVMRVSESFPEAATPSSV
ncbi:hypothetical protein I79_005117 [Cricetulus griseus]|uniref:Uncharacterized protein n=1 Tax=Cricetulus griseus TaxID=10029 RepID=G3H4B7_CRIGR|nr:hypothetical protein I79_005117 [Cricetulus griseus]